MDVKLMRRNHSYVAFMEYILDGLMGRGVGEGRRVTRLPDKIETGCFVDYCSPNTRYCGNMFSTRKNSFMKRGTVNNTINSPRLTRTPV